MSTYQAARIEKPKFFRLGPLHRGRSARQTYVIGFDSEQDTRTGEPMLYQFSLPLMPEDATELVVVRPGAGLDAWVSWVHERAMHIKNAEVVIYGFNLQYEFTQLFGMIPPSIRNEGTFTVDYTLTEDNGARVLGEYEITVYADRRFYLKMSNVHTHRRVTMYDAFAYYHMGLNAAAGIVGIEGKLDADRTRFTRKHLVDPSFRAYARRDAFITRKIGEHIIGLHDSYDIRTTVSAPHFSASVFRRHYLSVDIPLPEQDLEQYGLYSYHGGKNGYYLTKPAFIEQAYNIDIRSAYPEAMRQMPDIEQSTWEPVTDYVPGRHAIYRATVEYEPCRYRGLMTNDNHWIGPGRHTDVYITSYELDQCVARNEARVIEADGYEMVGPTGGAFVRFVDDTYARKRDATNLADRETNKLLMNSLYGKTFQKVALGRVGYWDLQTGELISTDPDQPYDYRAGGLYHPPMASLITGYVRARIHGLEHNYKSVMTSTDGLFAMRPPPPDTLGIELGNLSVQSGTLRIWRERLYVFDPDDGTKRKTALHGWRGDADQLLTIPLERGRYDYEAQQMVTLRLSTRMLGKRDGGKRYRPGTFATLPYTLDLGG